MKRFLAMILAFLLVFSMAACNKTPVSDNHETESTESTNPTTEATECPHDFVANKTEDPTCEKEGYTLYICTLCKATEERDKTEKLEHVYTVQVTRPTKTEKGYSTYTCEVCGYSYADNYIDALGEDGEYVEHTHEFKDTVKAPTCTTEGYTNHKCDCGESYNDTKVPATGHQYVDTVVNPTCTTNGYTSHKCSHCGNVYSDSTTKAIGHNYTAKVVEPTKDAQGYTLHTCTRCNDSYKDNYKDPLGDSEKPTEHVHSYTESVTKPTCTTEGYTTHTCACGDSYVDNIVPAVSHEYVDTVTQPTCTAEGYTTHKCKNCGSAYTDTRVAATGHSYVDTVVAPTCEEKGYTQHKCERCGNTTKDTYTNAIGHNYSLTSDTATCTQSGTRTETCGNCGKTKTSTSAAKGHGDTKTVVVAEATCRQEGKTQTVCTVCNAVLSESTTPKGNCNYVTDTARNVSNVLINANDIIASSYAWIGQWEDGVLVDVCYGCYNVKNPRVSNGGTAEMLRYVNELRRSVGVDYGIDLESDSACIALAQLRAKEISTDFSHNGMRAPSGFSDFNENIHRGGSANVYSHYNSWFNSPGHYQNMTLIGWTHFGYGAYLSPDALTGHNTAVYAVQIFAGGYWDP